MKYIVRQERVIIEDCGKLVGVNVVDVYYQLLEDGISYPKLLKEGYEPDKRKKKYIQKDLKIEYLIQEAQDGKIELLEYLSEISKLFIILELMKKKIIKLLL